MDDTDKAVLAMHQKSQLEEITPVYITNGKIYFHWSSSRLFSLFLDEVDEIEQYWFFGTQVRYKISVYTFMYKAVTLQ